MRRRAIATLFLALLGFAVTHGCAPRVTGGDSESHFMRCKDDTTCLALGSGFVCANGLCQEHTGGDAGPRGGAGGALGAPSEIPGFHGRDAGHEAPPPGAAGDGCTHATYPARPNLVGSGGDLEIVVAQYDADLGDGPPSTTAAPTRYRDIGFDLDGICSTIAPDRMTGCVVPAGSGGVLDGPGGIDNAFGQVAQYLHDRIPNFGSEVYTSQLQRGAANVILHVTGYNGRADDDQVRVELLISAQFDAYKQPGAAPQWDGNDVWPVDGESVTGNNVANPKSFDPNGYVSGGKLVATFTSLEFRFLLGITDVSSVNLLLALRAAVLVCTVTPTDAGGTGFTLENCTLAGRWAADDLVKQLSRFPDPLDLQNPKPLCMGAGSYPIFKASICALRDVSSEPAGPTTPCDALSFGMVFDTRPAMLGAVYVKDLLPPSCPAGTDPSLDSCEADTSANAGIAGAGGTAGGGASIRDAGADR